MMLPSSKKKKKKPSRANDDDLINNAKDGNLKKVRDLLHKGANVNAKDEFGNTALTWACHKSLSDVALEILKRDNVDVNAKDSEGRSALICACDNSLSDVALEILKLDNVDVNAKESDGLTALHFACFNSLSDVALEILQRDNVDVNAKDSTGVTALICSCISSLSDVALGILKRDIVDVNAMQSDGWTALHFACINGHADVALEILKRDNVDVNAKDSEDRSALYWACNKSLSYVALEILKRDNVDVNAKDSKGQSALYLACCNRLSDVALEILKRDNVDVNAKHSDGWTVLHFACDNRLSDVALGILKLDTVDVNTIDSGGVTALQWACINGHVDVALEILKRDNVDVNAKHSDGWTALHVACDNGLSDVALGILKLDNVDVNTIDSDGVTALQWACRRGLSDVALEILKRDNVDVNAKDSTGVTALHWACINGHADVALEILKRDNVDVNAKDSEGQSALYWACNKSLSDVALEILKRDNIDVNSYDSEGQSALYWACNKSLSDVALEILKQEIVDVNAKHSGSWTALHFSCINGNADVALEILKRDNVDVNAKDSEGRSALYWACNKSLSFVALEILKRDNVDVNAKDSEGHSALYLACGNRLSDVALEILKRDDVDVNAYDSEGLTALYWACNKSLSVVALEILKRDNVEVNFRNKSGETAIDWARQNGLREVVCALLPPSKVDVDAETHAKLADDRSKLSLVMSSTSMDHDPVEFSLEFIKQCTFVRKLGSGAFGHVVLAEDRHLQKLVAIKKIKLDKSDQESVDKARKTFQMEISTLKRFHHPNIIVLYGYNLNVSHTEQFLVYEYAANGSLDGFFKDDGTRSRLPADKRLMIMFELARAVHFLHTGKAGWKVFHRDIKSANICLAGDFTARLIDCGLAKFVPDEDSSLNPEPGSIILSGSSEGPAFGTVGYMCPEYLMKKAKGFRCRFIAAYDVYSIGVVMAELVLGRLNGQPRNREELVHVFQTFVENEQTEIKDGWKLLQDDADRSIIWNPKSLQLVCKTAIQCMDPSPDKRLSTENLMDEICTAKQVHDGTLDFEPKRTGRGRERDVLCDVCNHYSADIGCSGSKPHALCMPCIQNKGSHYPYGRCDTLCPIDGCSSKPLDDDVLRKLLPREIFTQFESHRDTQRRYNDCIFRLERLEKTLHRVGVGVDKGTELLHVVKNGVDATIESLEKQLQMLQGFAKGLERSLAALHFLAAKQSMPCPNLVCLTPVSITKKELENPVTWIKKKMTQNYKVVFVCAHSGKPGHEPFEIQVPRKWIVEIAPWLIVCLQVLKYMASAYGLPFPIPSLEFDDQGLMLKAFLFALVDVATQDVLSHCETLVEKGTIPSAKARDKILTLTGDAFKMIAEKAMKETVWQHHMVPVSDPNGTIKWVKGEYQNEYLSVASDEKQESIEFEA
ncbi:serine/threonine kinase [Fragilaria crotonensis]|nr:serine/threonine kinase [Fragilaria crotonensis]